MSWDAWAERVKAVGCAGGGIYGLDGSEWGAFAKESYQVDPQTVKNAQQCMASGPGAATIQVNGKKMIITHAEDGECMGKCKSEMSFVALKSIKCIVVGIGGEQSEPRSMRNKLERVINDLKGVGY